MAKPAKQLDKEIAASLAGAVTIVVRPEDTDADEDTTDENDEGSAYDAESYTISDDGDEFDDTSGVPVPDVQGAIDERRLWYRDLGRSAVLDVPAGRGWR